ncbi:MAG: ATP-binding protein [Candidatus Limisoma sp.]
MRRPFIYGELAQDDNFIDRIEDRKRLKTFLGNGINVMLISPRRWGKSSLVKATMKEMLNEDKKVRVCFIDAFKITSESEFYNAYATAVFNGVSSSLKKGIEVFRKYVQALSPSIIIKSDPMNALEVDLGYKPLSKSAEDILNLPEKIAEQRGLQVIVCIDEFQNLANLKEWKRIEGTLRSIWQQHRHTTYCLYGSKRHMMLDIFNNSANPFYRFGQVLYLEKISKQYWIPYIVDTFSETGKSITREAAEKICDAVDCHSWYVQQLSFFVWADTEKCATTETVDNALLSVIETNRPGFESDAEKLSSSQMAMLRAIANGESHLNSAEVVSRYHLGGPQTITRNKKVLVEKDLIEKRGNGFEFVDPLFRLWIIRG